MAPVPTSPSAPAYSSLAALKAARHTMASPPSSSAISFPLSTPLPTSAPGGRPTLRADAPARMGFAFDPIEDALAAFARGEFLVVMDDEGRENEGDLIVAASECTTEKMAWMIKHTSGYICIGLPQDRLAALSIPMMVPQNEERHRTAYTVTVDYHPGTTTGISAHDRALTARALAAPSVSPTDFTRPGHMVPLRTRSGGVLTRPGHTEASVDLCRATGLPAAGLLCELVNDDEQGSMARRDDCRAFADRWGIKMISIEMLIDWRRKQEAANS